MFLSVKKYAQILKALATLASRPYLQAIRDNGDGTVTFEFVQGGKVYLLVADSVGAEDRMLN